MAYFQAKGAAVYNVTTGALTVLAWLEDADAAIQNGTACTLRLLDHAATVAVANADWTTAPTENSLNQWYAVLTSASSVLSAGKPYSVEAVITVGGTPYTRYFPLEVVQ